MNGGTPVLLLGAKATPLGERLEISGYRCQRLEDPGQLTAGVGAAIEPPPEVVVVGLEANAPEAEPLAELLGELRRRWPTTPVLLDIGSDSVEGRSHCLSSGADDFWLSSLGASDLLARVRLQLQLRRNAAAKARTAYSPPDAPAGRDGMPKLPAPPLLRCGDLRLDPQARQAWRGRRPLELTGREVALLRLLLEHCGEAVSREQILTAVWDDGSPASSNVIEVYVRYLRQKLEAEGERRLIHTVRGLGYSLGERPPQRP